MSELKKDDLEQVKRATAAAIASIVVCLDRQMPGFSDGYMDELNRHELSDPAETQIHRVQFLSWIRTIIESGRS